jgi:hypothetical protein
MAGIGGFGPFQPNQGIWQGPRGNDSCVRDTGGPIFPRTGFENQDGVSDNIQAALERMRSEGKTGRCRRHHHGHHHFHPGQLGPKDNHHHFPFPTPFPKPGNEKPPIPDVRMMYGGPTNIQPDVRAMYGAPTNTTPDVRMMYGMPAR